MLGLPKQAQLRTLQEESMGIVGEASDIPILAGMSIERPVIVSN